MNTLATMIAVITTNVEPLRVRAPAQSPAPTTRDAWNHVIRDNDSREPSNISDTPSSRPPCGLLRARKARHATKNVSGTAVYPPYRSYGESSHRSLTWYARSITGG